jgi:hypothetical protein
MIDMDELSHSPKTRHEQLMSLPIAGPEPDLDDEDRNDVDDDEGSTALLSGSSQRTRFEVNPSKVWPQVRSIVIEVRGSR